MTKERLEQYQSSKEEIIELKYKLEHLAENDTMVGNSTIFDYRSGYPVPQSVIGFDQRKYDNTRARYEKKIAVLEKECREIEEFVENIQDSLTRRIFRMRYIDRYTQEKISEATHISQGTISKKISTFLKME